MNPSTSIENVLLIDDLKHNLLSIHQLCDKGHLSNKRILLFVYFLLFLPMIVNFWLSFDACFLLEFWLSLMIMIDSYDDYWFLLMIVFFYWVLIVLDDCVWDLCWLSLIDCFWWLFFIKFWFFYDCFFFYYFLWWLCLSYVDCLWLIAFDDCFWLSFDFFYDCFFYYCLWWLCLRVMLIVFIDYFWWLFFILYK